MYHLVKTSIKIIKLWNGLNGGWIDLYMSQCILSRKTGDLDMTSVKDGLTISLPCEQEMHEYSLGKRIF